jgi:hypothetical protein
LRGWLVLRGGLREGAKGRRAGGEEAGRRTPCAGRAVILTVVQSLRLLVWRWACWEGLGFEALVGEVAGRMPDSLCGPGMDADGFSLGGPGAVLRAGMGRSFRTRWVGVVGDPERCSGLVYGVPLGHGAEVNGGGVRRGFWVRSRYVPRSNLAITRLLLAGVRDRAPAVILGGREARFE